MKKILLFITGLILAIMTQTISGQDIINPVIQQTLRQDLTNQLVIAYLGQETAETTLASPVSIGDKIISVTSSAGMSVGDNIFIVDEVNQAVFTFKIIDINANNVTVDMPSGNDIISGTYVGASNINMAVDGSVTPVKFNLKTGLEETSIPIHITRLMITLETTSPCEWNKFGDQLALTNGLYLRKTDGVTVTYFNVKSNAEFNALCYDVLYFDAAKQQGINGLSLRLTFEKLGAVIELQKGEDLEIWVQDDLTGIIKMTAVVEGHIQD